MNDLPLAVQLVCLVGSLLVTPWCYRTSYRICKRLSTPTPPPPRPVTGSWARKAKVAIDRMEQPGYAKCYQCGVLYHSHPRGCPKCSPYRRVICSDCGTSLADSLKTFDKYGHQPLCFGCQMRRDGKW